MRTLRLILYFLVGIMLSVVVVPAFAEDYPAAVYWSASGTSSYTFTDPLSACLSNKPNTQFITQTAPTVAYCKYINSNGVEVSIVTVGGSYLCPSGGTLKNVNGVQTCQNAPACPSGQTRNSAGQCKAPACLLGPNERIGTSRYQFPVPQPSGVTYCVNGCWAYPDTLGSNVVGGTSYGYALVNGPGGSGSSCQAGAVTPGTVTTPTTAAPVPCAVGQGSMSDSTGKVVCVDPSTPGATVPPVQSSSSKKTTYGDGSTSTTTTTNTCTGDGACSTSTTTTITGAGGGTTPGQAGTPGTSKTEGDDPKKDTSEFCAKNPNLQICKGGISEEGTQKQVLTEVKKLTSVDSNTDKTAITDAGKYAETPGYQQAKDADDNLVKYASGVTKNSEVEASKSTFSEALASGFWTEIPTAACSTPTYTIAGHSIEWDRWCEIVGMIQQIGAYGLWVMLGISMFVMLSGGRQS